MEETEFPIILLKFSHVAIQDSLAQSRLKCQILKFRYPLTSNIFFIKLSKFDPFTSFDLKNLDQFFLQAVLNEW